MGRRSTQHLRMDPSLRPRTVSSHRARRELVEDEATLRDLRFLGRRIAAGGRASFVAVSCEDWRFAWRKVVWRESAAHLLSLFRTLAQCTFERSVAKQPGIR